MTSEQNKAVIDAALAKISVALAGIAGDLAELKSQINTGMTQADVDAVNTKIDLLVGRAAALDAENPAPVAAAPAQPSAPPTA